MAKVFTTEITSEQITSDNPIHQRLFKAYVAAGDHIKGDVLEVGCGEGRGVSLLLGKAKSFTAVDKIKPIIDSLQEKFPGGRFISMNIPPLAAGCVAWPRTPAPEVLLASPETPLVKPPRAEATPRTPAASWVVELVSPYTPKVIPVAPWA